MTSLSIAVTGILVVALLEGVLLFVLIRDRRLQREDRKSTRDDFLETLREERAALRELSASNATAMAGMQGQIERQTGVLIALAQIMLGKEDTKGLSELPAGRPPAGER